MGSGLHVLDSRSYRLTAEDVAKLPIVTVSMLSEQTKATESKISDGKKTCFVVSQPAIVLPFLAQLSCRKYVTAGHFSTHDIVDVEETGDYRKGRI